MADGLLYLLTWEMATLKTNGSHFQDGLPLFLMPSLSTASPDFIGAG